MNIFTKIEKYAKFIFMSFSISSIVFGFFALKHQYLSVFDSFFYRILFSSNLNKVNDNKVTLIAIDNKFFTKEGVTISTFHRGYYAKLVEKINNYGATNIVFDVFFQDLKYQKGNNKLQKLFGKTIEIFDKQFENKIGENTVLGVIPNNNFVELPSKAFIKKGVWLGYVKSHQNDQNINDGVEIYGATKDGKKILNLGYAGYFNRLYKLGVIKKEINIKLEKSKTIFGVSYLIIKTSNKKYNYKIPLSQDADGDLFLFSPIFIKKPKRTYSIYDIIHDTDNIYESKFKNKTIFIGNTDKSLNDIKTSYVGLLPGVMFHINNFLSFNKGHFYYILPFGITFIILLIIYIIGHIFVKVYRNNIITLGVYIVSLFVLIVASFTLFKAGIVIPIGTIIIILTIGLFIELLYILYLKIMDKRFLDKIFDKYVGGKIREKKEKGKNSIITSENKNIVIMFSDIANFTNISERLSAKEVGSMLNTYFEYCGQYIYKSKGYIDKYIGDAIMAYWEDITYTDNILDAVINIQKVHSEIKKNIFHKLGKFINLETRIGLHYGEAIVGDIGDNLNKEGKIQATAIGDNVNLASRLEGINKFYKTNIILSEDFVKKIKNKENYAIRFIDKITVKGKKHAVKIYEVMKYEINEDIKKYIDSFEKALQEYLNGNFEKAKKLFENLSILKIGENDPLIKLFIERIEYLIKSNYNNWDGIWKYDKK